MLLRDLENLIRKATLEVLGLPDNNANASRVRISWPALGAPAWKISEDVIFIRVRTQDDPYNRPKEAKYQNNDTTSLIKTETYTRTIAVNWILYGPNSFDDADTLRNGIGNNQALKDNNLFFVFDRPAPIRSPELFNGQWWERTDYTGYFYEQVSREYTVPAISGVSVTIKTEKGDVNIGDTTP